MANVLSGTGLFLWRLIVNNKSVVCSLVAFALSGCSDLWNTYQVVDNISDMGIPDLVTPLPCTSGEAFVMENDSTYLACCGYPDPVQNASNIQTTFKESQKSALASSTQVTIKFSCAGATIGLSQPDAAGVSKTAFVPITRKTLVEGGGTVLDANGVQRFFAVDRMGELQLRDLRLLNGKAVDYPAGFETPFGNFTSGAAAALGGSILALGSVNLDRVAIIGSAAENSTRAHGGAIFIGGAALTISNSIFYKNRTSAESGVIASSTTPIGGAAMTVINTPLSLVSSSVIDNINKSANTLEAKGIIEILSLRSGTPTPAKFEKNIILNYALQQAPSNYSLVASCAVGAIINGQLGVTNVIEKYKDAQGGCGTWITATLPNPTSILGAPVFTFNNPVQMSRPGSITNVPSVDDAMKNAAKWTSNGELDFFGIARPVGSLCMPGAVYP